MPSLTNRFFLVLLIGLNGFHCPTFACTTILAGRKATTDGSVLNSHTCDGASYRSWLTIVPAQKYAPHSASPIFSKQAVLLDVTQWSQMPPVGTVPQVPQTYGFINTAYPCMNDQQLAFGESTFGGRPELRSPKGLIDCPELIRLTLERARTARAAIAVIDSLTRKYGYNDAGEILTISDPHEVWLLEILGVGPDSIGAVWATQRIPDAQVSVAANASRLRQLNLADTSNFRASANVYSLAEQCGWWRPTSGVPFEFCYVYAPDSRSSMASRRREWRVLSLLAPGLKLDPNAENYPFSVRPDTLVSVADLMRLFRDTYEATEFDMTKNMQVPDKNGKMVKSPYANPFLPYDMMPLFKINGGWGEKGERCIARSYCTYVTILQTRAWLPDPIGGLVWFGYNNPAMTAYTPLYAGITDVPGSFKRDGRPGYHLECAWWAFNRVAHLAAQKWGHMRVEVDSVRLEIENRGFRMQSQIETMALKLYQQNPQQARDFLTQNTLKWGNEIVAAYWKLGDYLWSKYTGKF